MGNRFVKWVLVPVLIVGAAYAGMRAVSWYAIKETVTQIQTEISEVASLQYTNIRTPVFGPIGLTGVRVQPFEFRDAVTIGSVLIHANDPVAKYHLFRALFRSTLPQSIGASVNYLSLPASGDIAAWIDEWLGNTGVLFWPGCAADQRLRISDLAEMGYQELRMDSKLDYRLGRPASELDTFIVVAIGDLFEIVIDGSVDRKDVALTTAGIRELPRFVQASVSATNHNLHKQTREYCAEKLGVTTNEVIEAAHQRLRDEMGALGMSPSPELNRAYNRFLTQQSKLTISFNPFESMRPRDAIPQDSVDVLERLALKVALDDKTIPNFGLQRTTETENAETESAGFATFQETSFNELGSYRSYRVIVMLKDGLERRGYLDEVAPGRIVVTDHLRGGSVTYEITRGEIANIFVFRR